DGKHQQAGNGDSAHGRRSKVGRTSRNALSTCRQRSTRCAAVHQPGPNGVPFGPRGRCHLTEVYLKLINRPRPADGPPAPPTPSRTRTNDGRVLRQAALTVARNLSTSALSRVLCSASDLADDSTSAAPVPVIAAPLFTSEMLLATSVVPCAACWMLRVISCVAAPCSSTADAMVVAISETRLIVPPISLIALTDSCVAACISAICVLISLVALAVCEASCLTSWATTAKPLPASPARAASIVALSASRLVCSAIDVISCVTSPMRLAACASLVMRSSVFAAWLT